MKKILPFLLLLISLLPCQAWAVALINSKVQYVDSTEYNAVSVWVANTAYSAGQIVRQATVPTLGNERVFACIIAGTSGATEPTWVVTNGAKTTDNTVTWMEITGGPGVNGDTTNASVWGASLTTALGQIIYDSTTGSLQIVTTAGTTKTAPAPSFSATAGVTTTDNTTTWTSLGLASNFGAFAAPHKRILNADASGWQTNTPATIYIGDDHAETQTTSMTLVGGQGTAPKPNQYLTVSHLTAPPTAVTTGASVSTTTTGAITISGYGYYYGITFSAGSGASASQISVASFANSYEVFDTCTFSIATTAASEPIIFGASSATNAANGSLSINDTYTFGATSDFFGTFGGQHTLVNPTIAATGSIPATLIGGETNGAAVNFIIRDADLSNITGTLYTTNSRSNSGQFLLENCKLGAGVAMTSGTFTNAISAPFKMHNCDSGTKNYRFYETGYLGTIQQETTTVDNTNPASDGTTTISWNIATSANTAFGQPYSTEYLPVTEWENTTGSSVTVKIEIAGANSLTNADIWPECEVLDNSGFPIGDAISGRASSPLATPTTWATSTDSWGGSPAHTQELSVTGTPQLKGLLKCRIFVAKPSITEYISPILVNTGITSARQYLIPGEGYVNEGPSSGGSCSTIGHVCAQ